MKTALNVIGTGLAASLCLSLLAACDGRGATPFKSQRYTPEEYAQHKAEAARAKSGGQNGGGQNGVDTPAPNPTPGAGGENTGAISVPAYNNGSQAPGSLPAPGAPITAENNTGSATIPGGTPETPKNLDTAQAKRFNELDKAQQELSEREKLIAVYNKEVERPNEAAKAFVKEISVDVGTSAQDVAADLSVKAAVMLDKQERYLRVEKAPLAFEQNGTIIPMQAALFADRKMEGEPSPLGKSMFVLGFCPQANCKNVYLMIKFATETEYKWAVFGLLSQNGKFEIITHNLGERKEFSEKGDKENGELKNGESEVGKKASEGGSTSVSQNGQAGSADKDKNKAAGVTASPGTGASGLVNAGTGASGLVNSGTSSSGVVNTGSAPADSAPAGAPAADSGFKFQESRGDRPRSVVEVEDVNNAASASSGSALIDLRSKGIAPANNNLFDISSAATRAAQGQEQAGLELQQPSYNTKSVMFNGAPAANGPATASTGAQGTVKGETASAPQPAAQAQLPTFARNGFQAGIPSNSGASASSAPATTAAKDVPVFAQNSFAQQWPAAQAVQQAETKPEPQTAAPSMTPASAKSTVTPPAPAKSTTPADTSAKVSTPDAKTKPANTALRTRAKAARNVRAVKSAKK